MADRNAFGKLIRSSRKRRDWTQQELADEIGKSKAWVVNVELGRTVPLKDETLSALALALRVDRVRLRAFALHSKNSEDSDDVLPSWEDIGESLISRESEEPVEIKQCSPMSFQEVSETAEGVVEALFPESFRHGTAIPVLDAFDLLDDQQMLEEIEAAAPIKFAPYDVGDWPDTKPEGQTCYQDSENVLLVGIREDMFERATEDKDGRARFTLAHELAHALLHGDLLVEKEGQAFRDETCTAQSSKPDGIPYYRWPEWQANVWASAFLMPAEAIRSFVEGKGVADEEFSIQDMAQHFQVSVQAARIRLEQVMTRLVGER